MSDSDFGELVGALEHANHGLSGQAAFSGYIVPANIHVSERGGQMRIDAESETLIACPDVAGTLSASGAGSERPAGNANETDPVIPTIGFNWTSGMGITGSEELCPTIKVGTGLGIPSPPAVAFAQNQRGELRVSDVVPAVNCGGGKPGEGYPAVAFQESQAGCREYDSAGTLRADGPGHDPVGTRVRMGMAVRRLTPRECERLQGVPDDYTAIPFHGKPSADGPRYKALGNAWAVPPVKWIFTRIDQMDKILRELESGK